MSFDQNFDTQFGGVGAMIADRQQAVIVGGDVGGGGGCKSGQFKQLWYLGGTLIKRTEIIKLKITNIIHLYQ